MRQGYSGKSADVWACAVTLYQLVFTTLPFVAAGRLELYDMIKNTEPVFEESKISMHDCRDYPLLEDLLKKMLKKDPTERISVEDLQHHPWITKNGKESCDWKNDVECVKFEEPTQDDLHKAISKVEQIRSVYFKKK